MAAFTCSMGNWARVFNYSAPPFRIAPSWLVAGERATFQMPGAARLPPAPTDIFILHDPAGNRILRFTDDGHLVSEIDLNPSGTGDRLSGAFAVYSGYIFVVGADGHTLHILATDGSQRNDTDLAPELGPVGATVSALAVSPAQARLFILDGSKRAGSKFSNQFLERVLRAYSMPLLLTETDVKAILTMPLAMEAVEESFQRLADGTAIVQSRQRLHLPGQSFLHYMAAGDAASGYMGMKIYTTSREGARFLVPLIRAQSGEWLALIEADYLGQMRTGAASGVATRWMAREDARTAGIIGTGLQARTQLEAIALARKLDRIRAFGRDAESARAVCEGNDGSPGNSSLSRVFGGRSRAGCGYRGDFDELGSAGSRWPLPQARHAHQRHWFKLRAQKRTRCRGCGAGGFHRRGFA